MLLSVIYRLFIHALPQFIQRFREIHTCVCEVPVVEEFSFGSGCGVPVGIQKPRSRVLDDQSEEVFVVIETVVQILANL